MPSEDWETRPCTPLRAQHMLPRCQLRSLPAHPRPLSPNLPPDNPVGPTLGELVLDLAVDVAEELDVSHGCLKQQRAHTCWTRLDGHLEERCEAAPARGPPSSSPRTEARPRPTHQTESL